MAHPPVACCLSNVGGIARTKRSNPLFTSRMQHHATLRWMPKRYQPSEELPMANEADSKRSEM